MARTAHRPRRHRHPQSPASCARCATCWPRTGVEAVSAGELGLPEPEETGTTFRANARIKAVAAAQAAGLPALADDSGLCVAALDGEPGIYSARWAGPGKDFRAAMERIEEALRERDAFEPGRPRAPGSSPRSAVAWPDGHVEEFEGRVDGTLVWPPRGARGFGYDPMFLPDGDDRTFGEMADGGEARPAAARAGPVPPRPRLHACWRRPACPGSEGRIGFCHPRRAEGAGRGSRPGLSQHSDVAARHCRHWIPFPALRAAGDDKRGDFPESGRRRGSSPPSAQFQPNTWMTAGTRMTISSTGRKNRIIGTVSLGGSAAAFFSASFMRSSRPSCASTRSAWPSGVP